MPWILLWLACTRPADPAPPAEDPAPLADERARLHRAELDLLRAEAEAALGAGDEERALVRLAAAERLGGLPDLNDRLVHAAERDPALAAAVHAALAEAIRDDPERAGRHHAEAARLAVVLDVRERYREGARASSLARVAGVDRTLVRPVLELALSRHVEPPDLERTAASAAARMQVLFSDPGVSASWAGSDAGPGPESSRVTELPELVAAADRWIELAGDRGIPEAVAVSEWVDGALGAFDPWTRVAWPAELGAWEAHHSGVQVGVGLDLEAVGEAVYVSLPVPGAPGWTAGIHRGDRITAIDDTSRRTTPADGVVALREALGGEPGSTVGIEVVRGDRALRFDVERAPVRRQTVHGWRRGDDNRIDLAVPGRPGVGYVRIEVFRSYTDEELREALEGAGPLDALLVDLRGNGGGDVQAAANAADLFAGQGVVAQLEGPGAPPPPAADEVPWNALVAGDPWEDLPLAVLIDRDTASAAEIAAGALAEREGVVLVGERTFGKGWSQGLEVDEVHGFALQVTNAAWLLPSGRRLQRDPADPERGVAPDVPFVASAAEGWQNQARRTVLEFPRTHADGSPIPPPVPEAREDLPVLSADAAILLGIRSVQSASAPPQDEPAPAVQPKQ